MRFSEANKIMFSKPVGIEMMRCWDCGIAAENVGEEESVISNYATRSRVARDVKKSVTQDARREEKAKKMVGKVGERKGRPGTVGRCSGYGYRATLEIGRIPMAG